MGVERGSGCSARIPSLVAMPLCPKCGFQVRSEAQFCEQCASPLHDSPSTLAPQDTAHVAGGTKTGNDRILVRAGLFLVVVGLIWLVHIGRSESPQQAKSSQQVGTSATSAVEVDSPQPSFSLRQTVHVGYWSYVVWDTKWKRTIGSGYLHKTADSMFLVANVTVRNDDRTASTLPPFELVDIKGREYAQRSVIGLDGSLASFKVVNPGVQVDGYIVFDVPEEGDYRLEVSGGFTSGQTALINLH